MSWCIREATEDDFTVLGVFLDRYLAKDYFIPYAMLRHVLTGRYHRTLLCIEEDEILGVAILTTSHRRLVNLLVAPCERKSGIGATLLSRIKPEQIRAKLDVSAGDPRDFYRSRGFRSTGQFNRKHNIEIMTVDVG